ncbi:MAG: DNA helicase HerA-like ATPase [Flavobacteriales bacterium]
MTLLHISMKTDTASFKAHIEKGYTFKKDFIVLGTAMLNGEPVPSTHIKVPLKTLNRHGLIAGATGTGKTKTLQVIAEQLSCKGIPSLLMDLKGDLSGLAQPGSLNDHIVWRQGQIGIPYVAEPMPVELLTISDEPGVRMRATISEFGPVLLAKILNLNDTQEGVLAMIFKYCDDNKMPLLDLNDMKSVLKYSKDEGKEEFEKEYGMVSSSSIGTIQRKIIALEQQGAEKFFGERSFDVEDLTKVTRDGKGIVSIMRLTDIQDKPKLFSTFMLSLLAEVYSTFEEQGDSDQPRLCIFIDEAHLVFKEASSALLDQIEAIVKLIRSKGVGIFFCTQNPTDVPDAVLGQLGLKVQHALRAFTAKDRKAINKTAENYPISPFYETDQILTQLGIGEALVTALNEKGIPTPLAATLLQAPKTRMDILTKKEIKDIVSKSDMARFYNEEIDRDSAFEILKEKVERASKKEHKAELQRQKDAGDKEVKSSRSSRKKEKSFIEKASQNTMVRQVGRTIFRELARGILGALGVKNRR